MRQLFHASHCRCPRAGDSHLGAAYTALRSLPGVSLLADDEVRHEGLVDMMDGKGFGEEFGEVAGDSASSYARCS